MKRYILSMMLATIFLPAFAVAQEKGPENIDFQMEMRQREMELQQQEAQMDIERRTQELELDKRKMDLEREKPKDIDIQMETRGREMKLQHQKDQMDIERKMQELDLEKRKIEMENMRRPKGHPERMKDNDNDENGLHLLLLLVLVVHILCAVWVYQDIRQRAGMSGIWIVIALLTGLLGTLVYAVVRLGEIQKSSA
jgi:hypothetical protein